MIKWLENLRMKNKLLVLLFTPCLLLLSFAIINIIQNYEEIKNRENENRLSLIVLYIDQLTDSFDEINRLSQDYLENKSEQIFKLILEKRQLADQKINQLKAAAENKELLSAYETFNLQMNQFFEKFDELPQLRRQVDFQTISPSQVNLFYSSLDANALSLIFNLLEHVESLNIAKFLYAYVYSVEEQRAAEKEKNLISNALSKKSLSLEDYSKLIQLATSQENYRRILKELTPASAKNLYGNIIAGQTISDTLEIRNHILVQSKTGNIEGDQHAWDQAQNSKIQLIQHFQNEIFLEMQRHNNLLISQAKNRLLIEILLTLIAFIITALLTWAVSSVITKPLKDAADLARRVSGGNLQITQKTIERRDEIGTLDSSLYKMVDNLKNLTQKIQNQIHILSSSSEEIMSSISELTTNTSETAAAVSETTATVEELRQTGQLSSEKAKDVQNNAEEAVEILDESEKSLNSTIDDMHEIDDRMVLISDSIIKLSEHSQAIRKIIDTVNELAEQSNLLAVNAAIEAAKAGEQGKGFNVVALEVRRLAEQSKHATIQIKSILNDIQNATNSAVLASEQGSKAVTKGVNQSTQTNNQLKTLSEGMNKFTTSASQIALSSQQQLVGVGQVTIAMTNIKETANQHLHSMRQIEQAVHEINTIGIALKSLIEQFKV